MIVFPHQYLQMDIPAERLIPGRLQLRGCRSRIIFIMLLTVEYGIRIRLDFIVVNGIDGMMILPGPRIAQMRIEGYGTTPLGQLPIEIEGEVGYQIGQFVGRRSERMVDVRVVKGIGIAV